MTDKITIVTYPDDYLENGKRLLLIDLEMPQKEMISRAMLSVDTQDNLICYVYHSTEDIAWAVDKSLKSQLIVVNANSHNQTLVGYLLAKSNCYYLGDLKGLNNIIDRVIYDSDQFVNILTKTFG
jgi:hypothetical protein